MCGDLLHCPAGRCPPDSVDAQRFNGDSKENGVGPPGKASVFHFTIPLFLIANPWQQGIVISSDMLREAPTAQPAAAALPSRKGPGQGQPAVPEGSRRPRQSDRKPYRSLRCPPSRFPGACRPGCGRLIRKAGSPATARPMGRKKIFKAYAADGTEAMDGTG